MSAASGTDPEGSTLQVELDGAPRRYVRRGDVLFGEGEPSSEAFYLHHGLVKMVKTAAAGGQSLVALRGTGAFVGEHSAIDGLPRLTSAVVVADSSVTAVPRERLIEAVRSEAGFALAMLAQFSVQLRATTRHVLAMATGDAVALVAGRLSQLAADPMFETVRDVAAGDSVTVRMPVSQQELATWAGVSHRSVTGALRRLREQGVITTGRLHVQIHDRARLAELAAGSPGYTDVQPPA